MRYAKAVCAGVVASFLLAGCSGAGVQSAAQSASAPNPFAAGGYPPRVFVASPRSRNLHGWMSPVAKTGPVLLVSLYYDNVINVYSQMGTDQSPIGQLTGSPSAPLAGPTGIAVAPNGYVYVSNYENGKVTVFKKGASTPFEELNAIATNYGGTNVAIFSAGSGNEVYVAKSPNQIQVFSGGSLNPTSTLIDANLSQLYSIAVDSHDNVFDMGYSASTSALQVDEFPVDSSTATVLPIDVYGCNEYGGLAVDASNNLYVDCSPLSVSEYAPPYTGAPARKVPYGGGYTFGLALTKADKTLWLASFGQLEGLEYTLKGKLKDNTSSTVSLPWGIAVSPASPI